MMGSFILCFTIFILGTGSAVYLFTHYKKDHALKAIAGIFIGVVLSDLLAQHYVGNEDRYYDEDKVFLASPWKQIETMEVPVTQFAYRPDEGLFVTTSSGDVLLTTGVSDCDGKNWHTRSLQIQKGARLTLPSPHGNPVATISFHIPLQDEPEVDTVVWRATAFAVYENGEVWCTEREVQRGQATGFGAATSIGFTWFCFMGLGSSFSITIVLIWLERTYKRHKPSGRLLHPWYFSRSALGRLLMTRA